MGIIQILDPHLTNMIAAGEVVDRPANIVKECVENSLDAGATTISIEAFEGGIDGIIITDDGCGMGYEDTRLAFKRHATSKIHSEEELFAISTMGFRGEALPSIASVAKVQVKTSTGRDGGRVVYEYGELKAYEKFSGPRGCRIEVRGLFQRTPARFKYLRKPAYEFSIIADTVNKIALAHPEVRFSLKHNGRLTFQTSGKNDRREILYQMFGTKPALEALEFFNQTSDFTISGYAMQPNITRASKSYIYISLNGRIIRSHPILKAICEGYREFMPRDRYPICYLNIEADYQLIDVNVHPNKYEVRISKEAALSQLIIDTFHQLFVSEMEIPEIKSKEKTALPTQGKADLPSFLEESASDFLKFQTSLQRASEKSSKVLSLEKETPLLSETQLTQSQESLSCLDREASLKESPSAFHSNSLSNGLKEEMEFSAQETNSSYEAKDQRMQRKSDFIKDSFQKVSSPSYPTGQTPKQKAAPQKIHQFFLNLRLIGQLKDSYILCESDEGLVIVDQHAAAERANFEKIQREFEKPVQILQPLMIPLRISLSAKLLASLDHINEQTKTYGLTFQPSEDGGALLYEIPAWMSLVERDGFLNDLFAWYESHEEVNMKELRRHLIATCACHNSVRFHHSLCLEEMQQILKDLAYCDQPYHCPHGRPTLISMSTKALEREFERE